MKPYVKLYYKFFDYPLTADAFVPCEICGKPAVDVNHIDCKGMGGSKQRDFIENLMGTCRECHVEHGDNKGFRNILIALHFDFIKKHRPNYPIQAHKMGMGKLNMKIINQHYAKDV